MGIAQITTSVPTSQQIRNLVLFFRASKTKFCAYNEKVAMMVEMIIVMMMMIMMTQITKKIKILKVLGKNLPI